MKKFISLIILFLTLSLVFSGAGFSFIEVETQAGYDTDSWHIALDNANNVAWFGGDNLASNLFDQDGGSGSAGDKGGFNLTDLRDTELDSGNLSIDIIYEISARTDQDFTADGALDNVIGTTFIANDTNVTLDVNNKVYPIDTRWNNFQGNLVSIDSDTLKITYVDNVAGAQTYLAASWNLSSNPVVDQLYKLQFDAKVGSGDSVLVRFNPTYGPNIDMTITNTEFQTFRIYFVATHVFSDQMQMNDMGAGEIIWLDNITIEPVTSPAAFAGTGNLVKVTDSGGASAYGYIGEAGSGETLGVGLLSNPSFDANTTGWTPTNSAILASVAGGVSNNALRITEGGADNPATFETVTVVLNKEYKLGIWVKQGTESTYRSYFSSTLYSSTGITGNAESTGTWVKKEWYGVAGDIAESLTLHQRTTSGSNKTLFFDEASFKEVTEPNPNSVHIYTARGLGTEGWAHIDPTFNPNAIVSFKIFDINPSSW